MIHHLKRLVKLLFHALVGFFSLAILFGICLLIWNYISWLVLGCVALLYFMIVAVLGQAVVESLQTLLAKPAKPLQPSETPAPLPSGWRCTTCGARLGVTAEAKPFCPYGPCPMEEVFE